ncbi:DUF5937 family protein [Jatrophihabitans sp. YIM 134969]
MLRIEVGPDDLAASRFALAPLMELEHLLRKLDRGGSQAGVAVRRTRWGRREAALRPDFRARVLRALRPTGWGVDFLAPPPTGMARDVEQDLAAVRATPLPLARAQIRRALTSDVDPEIRAYLRAPDVSARLADLLAWAWEALVAPDWPQLLAIAERDVLHRADRLARAGWAGVLEDMHPSLRWAGGAVTVRARATQHTALDGRGLLFVPSVFLHPGLATYLEPPWQPTIAYPARGSAALWEGNTATPAALARLLGPARAELLLRLDTPASTTQLVGLTGFSLGAVGDHLKVLRDAGFVDRGRAGRSVVYHRTAVGDAVVAGAAGD